MLHPLVGNAFCNIEEARTGVRIFNNLRGGLVVHFPKDGFPCFKLRGAGDVFGDEVVGREGVVFCEGERDVTGDFNPWVGEWIFPGEPLLFCEDGVLFRDVFEEVSDGFVTERRGWEGEGGGEG